MEDMARMIILHMKYYYDIQAIINDIIYEQRLGYDFSINYIANFTRYAHFLV